MSAVLEKAPTSTAGHHQWIPVAQLSPSPLNHRKIFNKEKMEELAASIRAQGIIQPILVRLMADRDTFEVVAGERRYRAAKMAGLETLPAIVRDLTDAQALELQVIENGQRVDPHPLEEAEGYDALLKCARSDGTKYTVDEIAAKVGKSRSYLFGRLKLIALCPEARKAFYEDKVDASKALLIARIAHHDTQRQALKDFTQGRYGNGEPMSYRDAHRHVLETYMLQLRTAPFDIKDANLVAKAGACGPCPKRTGNQADLFGDVKSADVCTDPKCFDDKRQALYSIKVRELEAQGEKVIAGDAAKKIMPHWETQENSSHVHLTGGYMKMDETSWAIGSGRKVRDIVGKDFKPIKLQHPGTGDIIEVATQQAVTAAASKNTRKGGATRKASAPRERDPSPDEIFRERLFVAIMNKLPESVGKPELQLLAREGLNACDACDLLANFFVPRKDGKKHEGGHRELLAAIPKMGPGDLARLAVAGVIGAEVCNTYGKPTLLLDAATRYKVDAAKIKKAIADEAKAKKAAEPAKKKAKK